MGLPGKFWTAIAVFSRLSLWLNGAGLNTDMALMRLFKREWSELNKAGRRERGEMARDITLITVMQQSSFSVYTIIL